MFDVVIRGGTIVDGTGRPRFQGDLAIQDGKIAGIGKINGSARETVDAAGLAVAPGFIDVHTHYDAQFSWDPYATCSVWHGITTVVMGNCGFGIAPCRPEHQDVIMRTLERVEGMSIKAMRKGIRWGFETFPQFLDLMERLRPGVNLAVLLGHSAMRLYVMGEESMEREASEGEVGSMLKIVREGMAAGAIGIGSTTTPAHNGADGRPVASRLASWPEFQAITRAMGETGKGVFEITIGPRPTLDELAALQKACKRPVVWAAFFDRPDRPELTGQWLAETDAFARQGIEVRPQVACRPLMMDFTLRNPYPFEGIPAWKRLLTAQPGQYEQVYADREFRAALKDDLAHQRTAAFRGDWERVKVLKTVKAEHRAWEGRSLPDLAKARGKDVIDTFFDLGLEDGLEIEFVAGLMNTDVPRVTKLITNPNTVITLSDAGAHLSLLCDAGYTSSLLSTWVRERGAFTLEDAVRRLSADPADLYRIPLRGRLQPGHWADVAVFDPATIAAGEPEKAYDLPAGEMRFVSKCTGMHRVLVNGKTVLKDGELVEAEAAERTGRVLREFGC